MSGKFKKITIIVLLLACFIFVGFWFHRGLQYCASKNAAERLLTGDSTDEVSSMVIKGQGVYIKINDRDVLAEFNMLIRNATQEGYVTDHSGIVYTVEANLLSGQRADFQLMVPADSDYVTFSWYFGLLDDPQYAWAALPRKSSFTEKVVDRLRWRPE
jgi:hypothetical protein